MRKAGLFYHGHLWPIKYEQWLGNETRFLAMTGYTCETFPYTSGVLSIALSASRRMYALTD